MVIPESILFKYHAELKKFKIGELIFSEGKYSQYYFQIQLGVVKLNNFFEDGKEFVHGFSFEGHCFGETYLLAEKPYAFNAIAVIRTLKKMESLEIVKIAQSKIYY